MRRSTACIVAAALAACAHDPVHPPAAPSEEQYTSTPLAQQTASADVHGGEAQRYAIGADIPLQWWTLFRSPELDRLVRQALENSPTLARARAKLRQAEEDLAARTGATRLPRVDAKLSANRIDANPDALGIEKLPLNPPLTLYLASVGVSYSFDLFGAVRHELEALQAGVDVERYELEGARLMLAGNVVTAAIREASLREQIASSEEIVSVQERRLAIVEKLVQLGTAAEDDLVAQRTDLAQARAGLPDLQRQLEQARHRLAVYAGRPPGAAQLPQFGLADLQLPSELPLSVPSALARQRPDIRAADALLQQAGARVGVATANLYPQLALSATLGSLTSHAGDLFSGGTGFYLLGASLTQPLFHGGELQARRRAAVAAYDQAGAAYQDVILRGFQDVADVLRALETDARKLQERTEAATQARRHRDILDGRYRAGAVSHYALLDAERRLHGALLDRVQAVADRYADSAALLQALGGGWWADSNPGVASPVPPAANR